MKKVSSMLMLVLLPAFGIFYPGNPNQSPQPESSSSSLSPADVEFLDEFEADFLKKLHISGCPGAAVTIVRNGQVIYSRGFGKRRHGARDLVDTKTVFRIGSLSKGFAGLLTSKMVEDKTLSWDDKVRTYIPEFNLRDQQQADRISIRHLLSHSTGLQRHAYTDLIELGRDLTYILPEFSRLRVYGKEGEYYAYQNTAFSMIEEIMYRKTGVDYNTLLSERIFKPAGMHYASTTYDDLVYADNVAYPHVWNRNNRCIPIRLNKKYYNAVSAGGINASIDDMAAWLKVLLGNRPDIIGSEHLDHIFEPVVKNNNKAGFHGWKGVKETHYGIGWRIVNWEDKSIVYHGGSVNGFRSEIAIDRKNNIGICVLFNSNNRYAGKVIPEFIQNYETFLKNQDDLDEKSTVADGTSVAKIRS
ncbi:MAG: beta-lactamase family protein [Saprospiraceae bacterium]|nr:beta-lactamase family protein [Saprospiraceae bacterium]